MNVLINRDAAALVRTALGLEARRTFLLDQVKLYPLYDQVNRGLAPSSRVMLSCYCGGYYIDRTTFCAETAQDSLRFTNWDDFAEDLQRMNLLEDTLESVLKDDSFATLALVSTGENFREWIYYAKSESEFEARFDYALDGMPTFPIEIHIASDPTWDTYQRFKADIKES